MERPYIVGFDNNTETSFDVTVHGATCDGAQEWTRDYFGHADGSRDYRNRNHVEYLWSDFDGNHTFRVHLGGSR